MQDLLDRLKKSDPGTYREWYASEGVYPEEGYELSDPELDILQGTIQRAIEAKGWFWRSEAKPYQAIIYDDDGEKIFKEGDSAASALLAAYLQALEANQ